MLITSSLAENCLGSPAKIRILTTLYSWKGSELTERQLASLCHLSTFGLRHALADLERWGIVTKKVVGRSNVWMLNKQGFVFGPLSTLLEEILHFPSPYQLLQKVLTHSLPLDKIERVTLFGSAARGPFDEARDIDVAVLCKETRNEKSLKADLQDKMDRLSGELLPSIGKRLEAHIFSHSEWKSISKRPLGEVIKKGREIFPNEEI